MDEKSLSHTSWNCKYHIVLVPKYRRKVIYGKLRKDIGKILRMLCDYKHVEIIEAHAMPDHIHMLLSIPPKLAVADFMGYLKGKSTRMIFERHANLKYKYGRRVFWTKGYYVNTVVSPSRKNGQEKCEKSRMKQTGANESKVKRQKLHTAAFQNRRAISIQSKSEDELCCRKLQYKQRYRSVPPAWSGSGADEPAHISDS